MKSLYDEILDRSIEERMTSLSITGECCLVCAVVLGPVPPKLDSIREGLRAEQPECYFVSSFSSRKGSERDKFVADEAVQSCSLNNLLTKSQCMCVALPLCPSSTLFACTWCDRFCVCSLPVCQISQAVTTETEITAQRPCPRR
jgi:hypothetical protein